MRTEQQPLVGEHGALVPRRWRCAGAGACGPLYGLAEKSAGRVGEGRDGLHVASLQKRRRKAPQG